MKMYILVRNDLSRSQKAVQAVHAMAEYLLNFKTKWTNGTVALLRVKNEEELLFWSKKLKRFTIFREDDMNNEATALCTEEGENFKNLRLL